ncbi:MDR/zinc-dependent alcohol dehydrogenase-like family protein [Paractinoplanes durhamensis]|uniref:Alcohol dehydrogenase n=1 Tax=Paractinoplanes durhamensis TaxID=113563 RepID=A0ABQ3YRL8_9ACTN|nr:hypothetical protein [Actinoplanes durhamensis]GIE00222.1 hypothetical protein Adu01nite_15720 [Actinoplanes durhamensis]
MRCLPHRPARDLRRAVTAPALGGARGGTLAIAGIYLTDVPALNYERELFQERTVRSVTANTRQDGRDLLAFAGRHHLQVAVTPYPMSRATDALADLAADRVRGAAVLLP